jgi:transcriptional regulator with XRE-family HTH domain
MEPAKKRKGKENLIEVIGLGERIRDVREQRQMSQRKLALAAKVPASTVGRLETGDMNGCYTNTIASIAEVLECSLEHLLSGRGPVDRSELDNIKPQEEDYVQRVQSMGPQTSILLRNNVAVWTDHPGWEEGPITVIGKHAHELTGNNYLWLSLSSRLARGQDMDAPIRMKVNGLWKEVYVKTADDRTDDTLDDGVVYTLLTLMEIPLATKAMEAYQLERQTTAMGQTGF